MKNKLFLTFLLLFFALTARADVFDYPSKISDFINKIPQVTDITCDFKQQKDIKNVKKPVVSGGKFTFDKKKGVVFETLYPVKSTVSYNNRDYKQINDVIKAISDKKYSKIEAEFDFYFQNGKDKWTLGLKPKTSSKTKEILFSIEIYGSLQIDKIIIRTQNGNKTTIWFTAE